MEGLLDKPIVLKLNANWERIGWTTPKKAFVDMCGGSYGGKPAAMGLSVTVDENGDLVDAVPLNWEEWLKLPVRECDLGISVRSGAIRCPLVIIAPNYARMPLKRPKLNREAILARDGYICQYTGRALPRSELNVDHVIPQDKGGRDSWENMVASDRKLNTKKGNRFNHEVGLSLIKKPTEPKAVPVSFTIREVKRPEHKPFIK